MVRSYLRHEPTQSFGLIASSAANSLFDGKLAFVPALEDVLVWEVKTALLVSMWHSPSHTSPVTTIAACPSLPSADSTLYAVGYQDGSVRIWSFPSSASSPGQQREATEVVCFNGHKKAVTSLAWDTDGARLVSGGTEGEIVVWDVGEERGIVRLHSHRSAITSLHFIPHPSASSSHPGYLLSTSLDTLLKLWDLQTSHCIQTVVAHRAAVHACHLRFVSPEHSEAGEEEGEERIAMGSWEVVTASGEGEVKGWLIKEDGLDQGIKEEEDGELSKLVTPLSSLPLPTASSTPITNIAFHPTLPLLFLLTSEKVVSVLRIRSEAEIEKKKARRKKRDKEKKKEGAVAEENAEESLSSSSWGERFTLWTQIHSPSKVKSFSFPSPSQLAASNPTSSSTSSTKPTLPLLLHLSTNSIETHSIPLPPSSGKPAKDAPPPEAKRLAGVETQGHRGDVRCLAVSASDELLASGANGSLKIWNLKTESCIRTMEGGYAVCVTWLPGDRHVIVGTKTGSLCLYDISSSTLLSETQAHTGAIWSIQVRPDQRGLVSGSADKDVKFWDFEMKETDANAQIVKDRMGNERVFKTKQLTLVHTRTLKMTDDVLSVRYSPDGRLLAVALLDSTVKVFYQDSLKFFLSLYGHKLPVLSMDISSDSKLLVTCSADKNIKIWGLDFGDCHKSIFAHDESVMQVAFERDSHYFWSGGKDKYIKYWDGDKFEMIQKMEGHHGEVWALAVSNEGKFVVSGSHDRSIRVWEKTDEPLFLEEEREKELDQLYDSNLADNLNRTAAHESADPSAQDKEVSTVTKQTLETLMSGEKVMEALDLADEERLAWREYERDQKKGLNTSEPEQNAVLKARGLNADENVKAVLEKIPNANLQDALIVLPFRYVQSMLECLSVWAKREWNTSLLSRILLFLLRTHHAQIVSTNLMRPTIISLRTYLRSALRRQRETVGYNLAALRFIQRSVEGEKNAEFWETEGMDEEKVRARIEEGQKKRKRVVV